MNQYDDTDELNTEQIAALFSVTKVTVGNWFRKGTIPADKARRVPVRHPNGLTIHEWRAPYGYLKGFRPPRRGPRRK